MTKPERKCRIWVGVLVASAALISGVTLFAQTEPAAPPPPAAALRPQGELKAAAPGAKVQPPAAGDGDYVGSETCITCHEDQHRRFKNTVMGRIFAHPRTAAEKLGCESCHGPGR